MNNRDLIKKFKEFGVYKNNAIDFEQGMDFHKNVLNKTQVFYKNYSFISFKFIEVENVSTCYIYYMFADNKDDFRNVFYILLNYCIGNSVKFIYYSEKEKGSFYVNFLKKFKFNVEKTEPKKYKYKYKCNKCGTVGDTCNCKTVNCYI